MPQVVINQHSGLLRVQVASVGPGWIRT